MEDSASVRTWRRAGSSGASVEYPRPPPASTSIHITALDGIVNVNSLFTLGVFLGLSWNPRDHSRTLSGNCAPEGNSLAENMVTFHVFSFSSFLFSSLIALCLKQTIRIHRNHHHHRGIHFFDRYPFPDVEKVNKALLRAGILVSAVGSVSGCGFLMLALVNVVQIKLGRLGCSGATAAAVVPLVILVPAAMLIYISIVFHAFIC